MIATNTESISKMTRVQSYGERVELMNEYLQSINPVDYHKLYLFFLKLVVQESKYERKNSSIQYDKMRTNVQTAIRNDLMYIGMQQDVKELITHVIEITDRPQLIEIIIHLAGALCICSASTSELDMEEMLLKMFGSHLDHCALHQSENRDEWCCQDLDRLFPNKKIIDQCVEIATASVTLIPCQEDDL